MIINDKIKVKTTNKNIAHYRQFFNDIKSGDVIEINVNMLSIGSKVIVSVICDNCGVIKNMMYKDYLRIVKNDNKYYCNSCKYIKIKKTNNIKYGFDNIFQLNEIKDKIKRTNKDKYGCEIYQQIPEYKSKFENTCLIKYGVTHPMKNIIFKNSIKKPKINISKFKKTIKDKYSKIFIINANKIHNNKYDYSLTDYINMNAKILIICPFHGEFSQRPKDHIHSKQGCPICSQSKGEEYIMNYLDSNKIEYEQQKHFKDCNNIRPLYFDFYLPEYNICIEFDGIQHYKAIKYFGGEKTFEKVKYRDSLKNDYCFQNNIKLLRIKYDDDISEKFKMIL
jgi:very-short-patch-repair endonuclease